MDVKVKIYNGVKYNKDQKKLQKLNTKIFKVSKLYSVKELLRLDWKLMKIQEMNLMST